MFEDYTVYKQWHKEQGRWYAYLYNSLTQHHTTMSWARYTMSLHLNRILDKAEEVDHINDDKTDDRLENLQLLTHVENCRKRSTGRMMVTLICPQCNKEFTREMRQTYLIRGGNPSHCSRACAAKKKI